MLVTCQVPGVALSSCTADATLLLESCIILCPVLMNCKTISSVTVQMQWCLQEGIQHIPLTVASVTRTLLVAVHVCFPCRYCAPKHIVAPACFTVLLSLHVQQLFAGLAIEQHASNMHLSCRMYATAAARSDGLLLLCGGRDEAGTPLGDAYGLARHRDGRWEWATAPGQHAWLYHETVVSKNCLPFV